jgi:hypothetical protein
MGIIQRLFGKKKDTSLESKLAEPIVSVQPETVTKPVTISKILVIEDTPKHLADAKAYFADKPVEVVYASTYEEAKKLYDSVDAVISDVYFPESEGKEATDMGVEVALDLHGKKPFVLCTSGYHHGSKLQHVCSLGRAYGWGEMVDGCCPPEGDVETKEWDRAYGQLRERASGVKEWRKDEELASRKEGIAKLIMDLAGYPIPKTVQELQVLMRGRGRDYHYSECSVKAGEEVIRPANAYVGHPRLFKVLEKGEDGMYTKVELI